MNTQQFEIFINLAENLSFTQTALKMNLSQSAVSQNIERLEASLGVTLFIRNRHDVILTPAGNSFYRNIKPIINIIYKARSQARQIENKGKMNLSIGYSGTPWEIENVPKLIRKFNLKYPEIKVYLEIYGHEELKQRLCNGDLDLIWTMSDIVTPIPEVNFIKLVTGYYVIVIANNFHPFNKKRLTITDLNHQSIIFLDTEWLPPLSINLQKKIRRDNKDLDIIYANNAGAENAMVQANISLGLWCNFVSAVNDPMVYTLPLKTNLSPQYGIAIRKYDNSSSIEVFRKWLSKQNLIWK